MRTKQRRPEHSPAAAAPGGNLRFWDKSAKAYEAIHRATLRRHRSRAWGIWRVPERELGLLGNVRRRDILELGCGAGWWSAALAEDGARPVGLDFSRRRLDQARRRLDRARLSVPLIRARAERIPFADAAFDLVLSDYGATTFADPYRTTPEVARVLRPGGRFVFAHASPFRSVTEVYRGSRLARRLVRPYFGLHALDTGTTREYQLTYAEWFRWFAACGLTVERLIEPQAPYRGRSSYASRRDQRWAQRWPMETIWVLRKIEGPASGHGSRRPAQFPSRTARPRPRPRPRSPARDRSARPHRA